MQTERYKTLCTYYLVLDLEENPLVEAANYQDHGSIDVFKEWLQKALIEFENDGYNP